MGPIFFTTPGEFRAWLEEHHETADQVVVGFHRTNSGRASMTWQEAVDEALCFGWIDGVVRRLDDERYTRRFTPRRARSVWSNVNVRRFGELARLGLVAPAGHRAFDARSDDRSGIYGHERTDDPALDPAQEERLRAHAEAWAFFQAQPPGYRRLALHWVTSAKRPETRERRLERLIADSAERRRVAQLTWRPAGPSSGR